LGYFALSGLMGFYCIGKRRSISETGAHGTEIAAFILNSEFLILHPFSFLLSDFSFFLRVLRVLCGE
jgi:hypothetical protein